MVSSSEKPASTQLRQRMFAMYSEKRAELSADGGGGSSKHSSPGSGLSSKIQLVRLEAGLNQAACAIRFKCITGQRLSRQSVINWRQRDMIASASDIAWLRPSARYSECRSAKMRIGGSSSIMSLDRRTFDWPPHRATATWPRGRRKC